MRPGTCSASSPPSASGARSRADAALESIASQSRTLIAWVCAAAAVTGLLIGPVGLLLLRRVLARLQGVGSALLRLARNDTSIDIPGLNHQDEVGQLARSVAVFKAKSIELLQKKGEFERLNLQLDAAINNMPLGLSMFDARDRLLVCNRHYAEMYELPSELTRPGTAHCALWDHRARGGAQHHPSTGGAFTPDAGRAGVDDDRVRQRAHHLRHHPAAERRRLGGARRGRHPAPAPGAGDHPPCAPRRAHQPRQPRPAARAAAAGAPAPGGAARASPCSASTSTASRASTTRSATRSATRC